MQEPAWRATTPRERRFGGGKGDGVRVDSHATMRVLCDSLCSRGFKSKVAKMRAEVPKMTSRMPGRTGAGVRRGGPWERGCVGVSHQCLPAGCAGAAASRTGRLRAPPSDGAGVRVSACVRARRSWTRPHQLERLRHDDDRQHDEQAGAPQDAQLGERVQLWAQSASGETRPRARVRARARSQWLRRTAPSCFCPASRG